MEDHKYENIFNNAPIGIWEEDWSKVFEILEPLRDTISAEDMASYLNDNPTVVKKLAHSIKPTRINKKALEMHEANSEEELLNVSISDTFTGQSFLTFKEEMVALYNGESVFSSEAEKTTLKGRPLYLLVDVKLPQNKEDYKNVIVTMIDITAERATKQKLIETKAKFHESFYKGIVGMAITDSDGEFIEVNESFTKFVGYSHEELALMNFSQIEWSPTGSILQDMKNSIDQKEITTLKKEQQLTRKDGKKVWAEIGMNVLTDSKSNPLYFIAQIVDVDRSKKSAKKFEENVKKYKTLLESTNAMFILLDEKGNVKDASDNVLPLFEEKDHKQLYNKSLREIVSSKSMTAYDDAWKRINRGQCVNSVELLLNQNEHLQWVNLSGSIFINGKKMIFILLTDITERKRDELAAFIKKEKRRDKIRHDIQNLRQTIQERHKAEER